MRYNNWQKDLKDSNKAIMSIADDILPLLISGKIHSIENSKNKMLLMLDQCSGIDLIRQNKKGLQGIAVRVQFKSDFRTFTIRSSRHTGTTTELEKRIQQINEGYFYPTYTIQAYFNNRQDLKLNSIAIIETKQLYEFILNNSQFVHTRQSDNVFVYTYWRDLHQKGCSIKGLEIKNGFKNRLFKQQKSLFSNS